MPQLLQIQNQLPLAAVTDWHPTPLSLLVRSLAGGSSCSRARDLAGVYLVCLLCFGCWTDLRAAAMKGRVEGECRRIGGSPRTGAYRLAYISLRHSGPPWSLFLFLSMFSFLVSQHLERLCKAIQLAN
jgi:hypothetical protein